MDANSYLRLSDARSRNFLNQKVNIGGVILEFGLPRQTRGTDCSCHLKLIDESHAKPGVPVNVFEENMEKLPLVASPGDIVLLFNVVMQKYETEVYAIYNKKFSSFALYRGKDSEDLVHYQISPRFCARQSDKMLVARLRNWFVDFRVDEESTKFQSLANLEEGKFVNLVCKVLNKSETAEGECIFLWDGTDAPPKSIDAKLEDEMDNSVPLHLENTAVSRDTLCSFPTVGTILRVFVDKNCCKLTSHWMNCGTWVKFVNMLCKVQAGLWFGVLTSVSRFRYTVHEERIVLQCQRRFEERVSLNVGRMPYWCLPYPTQTTVVDHYDVRFSTLMEVLTYREVTAKFKCVVRFVAVFPSNVAAFTYNGTYVVRFTIEDPTARLHAFAYAEDAEKFFGNCGLVDLKRKVNKLLGVLESEGGEDIAGGCGRNPPWVQCCLKAYYTDKKDKWGSRHYRIFDTQLV